MGCSPWSHKESDMTEQLTPQTLAILFKEHRFKDLSNFCRAFPPRELDNWSFLFLCQSPQ